MSTDTRRPSVTGAAGPSTQAAGPPSLPRPSAARLQRPGWRDPRLLLGLVLVGGSVLLGTWVLGDAARTTPVLVARSALVPGDTLTSDAVETLEVRLPDAGRYLSPEDLGSGVLVRTVGAGEIVPRAAVADQADLDVRVVGVEIRRVAPGVRAGALVDLWFVPAPEPGGGRADAPEQLAEGLVVAEVAQDDGAFTVGQGATVHLLVPLADLPGVLGALSAAGDVQVVAVAGGAG